MSMRVSYDDRAAVVLQRRTVITQEQDLLLEEIREARIARESIKMVPPPVRFEID